MNDATRAPAGASERPIDLVNPPTAEVCEHKQTQLRGKTDALGRTNYRQQCQRCGAGVGNVLRKVDWPRDGAPAWDKDLEQAWNQREQERYWQWKEARDRALRDDWFAKHAAYMATPQWRAKRAAVMKRDGGVCQACLAEPAIEVHHLTYDHFGEEPLFDLVAVCHDCHDAITERDRKNRERRP